MNKSIFFFIGLMFVVFSACVTVNPTVKPKQNFIISYNPGSSVIHPEFCVYHYSDTLSAVFVKLYTDELIFSEANENKILQAKVKIQYHLLSTGKPTALFDSASYRIKITNNIESPIFYYRFNIRTRKGKKYLLRIATNDLIRDLPVVNFINIDRVSEYDRQNFFVMQRPFMKPIFKPYFASSDTLIIQNNLDNMVRYSVDFYKIPTKLPAPPFSEVSFDTLKIRPDSSFFLSARGGLEVNLRKVGMYQIRMDTLHKEGLTLYNFGDQYPKNLFPFQLVYPLQYLTTKKEFEEIVTDINVKKAVDNFWLKNSGNIERARELIKVYYNRVMFANFYFSSFAEGWKSDRGMIYVIFGPPTNVIKEDNKEIWNYGTPAEEFKMLTFVFEKHKSPFTDNYYVMQRNVTYKPSWYKAVETWRKGEVYTEGK